MTRATVTALGWEWGAYFYPPGDVRPSVLVAPDPHRRLAARAGELALPCALPPVLVDGEPVAVDALRVTHDTLPGGWYNPRLDMYPGVKFPRTVVTVRTHPAPQEGLQPAGGHVRLLVEHTHLSREGVVDRLLLLGYPWGEAEEAVAAAGVDWGGQAVKAAAAYQAFTHLSGDTLVWQLRFDGFTHGEAAHAVRVLDGEA